MISGLALSRSDEFDNNSRVEEEKIHSDDYSHNNDESSYDDEDDKFSRDSGIEEENIGGDEATDAAPPFKLKTVCRHWIQSTSNFRNTISTIRNHKPTNIH